MNEIPFGEWVGEARVFELVHEFQSLWGGHPYGTETRVGTSQIYKTNTIGKNKNHAFWGNTRPEDKKYECCHILHLVNKNLSWDYISTHHWLSNEFVDHILGKKEMDFSNPKYLQVTRPNLYFPVGQILRRGDYNSHAKRYDVITVGQYYDWSGGRQHDADGQLICIDETLLAEITQQTQN